MSRYLLISALALFVLITPVVAQDITYYRVNSTQQTVIINIDVQTNGDYADITWTNSLPDPAAHLEWTFWLDGMWSAHFDYTNVTATTLQVTDRIPTPHKAPSYERCSHNLYILNKAKLRLIADEELEPGDIVSVAAISAYLDAWVACPDGGYYVINNVGTDPTCSHWDARYWGHQLPPQD